MLDIVSLNKVYIHACLAQKLKFIYIVHVLGVRPLSKVEEQRRRERLREGRKAYTASTDHERNQIVEAFRRAKGELPARRNTYIDAAKVVLASRQRRGHQSLMIDARYQGTAAGAGGVETN